ISVSFGLNGESVKLTTFDTSPPVYIRFANSFGNEYRYGALTSGWRYDSRDSLIRPTTGTLSSVGSEFAGGDLEYYRLAYVHQYFYPLSRRTTLYFRGELGYAGGLNGKPLPFFKNYYAGGAASVRGYTAFSLG